MQENCAEPSWPHRQVALLNDMVAMLVFNALQDLKSQTNSSPMLRVIKIHVNVEISRLKMAMSAMFPSTLSPPKKVFFLEAIDAKQHGPSTHRSAIPASRWERNPAPHGGEMLVGAGWCWLVFNPIPRIC